MIDLAPADTACRLHVVIDTAKIVYLNSILDSYEGLAMMRTADEHTGEIIVYTTISQKAYVQELISALQKEGVSISITSVDYIDEVL